MDSDEDVVIVGFMRSREEYSYTEKGHEWYLYNPSLPNPFNVPNGDEMLQRAIDKITPKWYDLGADNCVRLEYQSIIDGNPQHINNGNSR